MTRKTTVGSITVPRVWPGHPDWQPRDETRERINSSEYALDSEDAAHQDKA